MLDLMLFDPLSRSRFVVIQYRPSAQTPPLVPLWLAYRQHPPSSEIQNHSLAPTLPRICWPLIAYPSKTELSWWLASILKWSRRFRHYLPVLRS